MASLHGIIKAKLNIVGRLGQIDAACQNTLIILYGNVASKSSQTTFCGTGAAGVNREEEDHTVSLFASLPGQMTCNHSHFFPPTFAKQYPGL